MKRILVTGINSYIGNSFRSYMENFPEYEVAGFSVRNDAWKAFDLSKYDSVFHVAGIAHADVDKVSRDEKQGYYNINTVLTIELAKAAKAAGVKQFIFMSSAIVYGNSSPIGQSKMIGAETPVHPSNFYGDSKVQAENGLRRLEDKYFKVVILRPPMIYGRGSKGNYEILSKLACRLPVFPRVKNQRSMLYVGNLVEFVRLMIENEERGTFWPANAEHSDISQLVKMIADVKGKRILIIPGFVWLLKILSHFTGSVNKAFGSLAYDISLSEYKVMYRRYSLDESIKETEG